MSRGRERPWEHKRMKQMAEEAFAKHVVKRESEGAVSSWLCRRPETNMYWFRVIITWNTIIFTGDLDELILVPYCNGSSELAWMRGALGSLSYFAEKIPSHIKIEEFDKELVKQALAYEREQFDEDTHQDTKDALQELEDEDFDDEHHFYRAYYDSPFYDSEMPGVVGFTTGFYWAVEALRWFVQQRPEDKHVEPVPKKRPKRTT